MTEWHKLILQGDYDKIMEEIENYANFKYEQGRKDERERIINIYKKIKWLKSLFINDFFREFEKELMKNS